MDDFDDILCEGQNGAYFDEDDWETVYPSGFEEEQDGLCGEVKPKEKMCDGNADEMERLMWLPEVVKDGHVNGEGTGVEITGVVATLLDNSTRYGFEFSFYEVHDPTPWDDLKRCAEPI